MNVTNEWGANYYVLVGTKQLNSINAFTTAPYSNGGNVVFWIALNSQKQWGKAAQSGSSKQQTFSFPTSFSQVFAVLVAQYGHSGGYDANSIATSVSNSAVTLTAQKDGTYILAVGK